MEPTPPPRIEIFAPFGEAFELMQKILFRPFDLAKWLVIGFAAWLATFFSGGGGYNYRHAGPKDWAVQWKSQLSEGTFSHGGTPAWLVPVLIVGVLAFLAVLLLALWLNARGRFIFTDCIVRNRGAIVAPWREYHDEGNRYFVFQLVISLISIVVFGGLGLFYAMGVYMGHEILPIALIIPFGLICLLIVIPVALIMKLAVPVMYRQRCDVVSAFGQIWGLMVEYPLEFILFVLFYIVIYVAGLMIGCLMACLTCCIAALPYIGTVILLPVVMVLYSYPLCFLQQFGDRYDVWAVIKASEPPAVAVPPVQELPPSPPPPPPAGPGEPPPVEPPPPSPPQPPLL